MANQIDMLVLTGDRHCPISDSSSSNGGGSNRYCPERSYAHPLRDQLFRWYYGKGENRARQGAMSHITLYGCTWYADATNPSRRDRERDKRLRETSSRAASVHVFDIGKDSFGLELRNVPLSVEIEKYVAQWNGTIDAGQTCMSIRLRVQTRDVHQLLALAELIRAVRSHRRVDRFGGTSHDSLMIHRALVKFVAVLNVVNAHGAGHTQPPLSRRE